VLPTGAGALSSLAVSCSSMGSATISGSGTSGSKTVVAAIAAA